MGCAVPAVSLACACGHRTQVDRAGTNGRPARDRLGAGGAAHGRGACRRLLAPSPRTSRAGGRAARPADGQRCLAATEPVADDGGRGHRLHGVPACQRLHRGRRVRGGGDRLELLSARPPHDGARAHAPRDAGIRLLAGGGRGDHLLPTRRFGRRGARVLGVVGGFAVRARTDARRAGRSRRSSRSARHGWRTPRKPARVAPRPRSETGWPASCTT